MSGFTRRHVVLYVIALLLACGCVVGGVLVVKEHGRRADARRDGSSSVQRPEQGQEERYGEVITAATATVDAMINIDYRRPQESLDRVAETSTGAFLEQYGNATTGIVQLVKEYKSVLTGRAEVAAVSSLDEKQAKVLVATTGKVSNKATGDRPQVRNFRMLLTLVSTTDGWLTSDLEFVG